MPRATIAAQLAKIRKDKADLEKREKTLLSQSRDKVLAQIVQLAANNALTSADIASAMKSPGKPAKASTKSSRWPSGKKRSARNTVGQKVPPKYRNPAKPDQTWTGRGRSPAWVVELKNAGTLDSAVIASDAAKE